MTQRSRFGGLRAGALASVLTLLVSPLSFTPVATAAPVANPFAHTNDLLSTSAPANPGSVVAAPTNALRQRLVTIQGDLFAKGRTIRFNLFEGLTLTGTVKTTGRVLDMPTWSGTLSNGAGYFYAARAGDAFIAHVAGPKGVYEVSKVGDQAYRVVELDQAANKEDAPGTLKVGNFKTLTSKAQADDSSSTIDVMVAYTDAALAGEGSLSALKARIALAVVETNGGYKNDGVKPRIRLVHIEPATGYTESGDFQTDLDRVINPSDGYMDNVPAARDGFGADMVALIIENTDYCGLASSILSDAADAYTTVSRTCATGYYSFGHEFGHLQGARHDVYMDPTTTPFSYGHGFTYPSGGWRTIMAYNNACVAVGKNCTRLQYWSNQSKYYHGVKMGNTKAQNWKVLNATAALVANFRTKVIANDFSSTFNSNHNGWYEVDGGWKIAGSAYYTSKGSVGRISSIAHTGTYGDLDFTAKVRRDGTDTSSANRLIIRGMAGAFQHWYPSYLFQWTTNGYYSVWKFNYDGSSTPLVSWTSSASIKGAGLYNTVRVVAVDGVMRLYINGTAVTTVSDTDLRVGSVGIGFYRNSADTTTAFKIDSATVKTAPAVYLGDAPITGDAPVSGGDINTAP